MELNREAKEKNGKCSVAGFRTSSWYKGKVTSLCVCVCVFSRFLLKDDDFQLSTRPYFYSVEIMEQWTTRSAVVLFFVGRTLDSSGILKSSLLHGMTLFYPLVNKHSY